MPHSTQFFGIARSQNKILSAFTVAVKKQSIKKLVIGNLACPIAVK
jgi:hypothetical protein